MSHMCSSCYYGRRFYWCITTLQCSPLGKSDHALLSFVRKNCNFSPQLPSTGPRLNLKVNYSDWREFLVKEWDRELPDDNMVDQMWSNFREILDEGMRMHISLTKPKTKNRKWCHLVDTEYKWDDQKKKAQIVDKMEGKANWAGWAGSQKIEKFGE